MTPPPIKAIFKAQAVEQAMNRKVIIIFILILIVLSAGAGVWKWKNKPAQNITAPKGQIQSEQNQNETAQEAPVDTSNWKTYRDKKYKFEIKYNPNWEIREVKVGPAIGGDFMEVIVDKSRDDIGMGINRFKTGKNPSNWYNDQGFGGATFDKEYLINNYLAYYVKVDNSKVYLLHRYLISDRKKMIELTFQEKSRKVDPKTGEIIETSFSQYLPDFEAMVNSIKFFD